jgi:hypothetical protein
MKKIVLIIPVLMLLAACGAAGHVGGVGVGVGVGTSTQCTPDGRCY